MSNIGRPSCQLWFERNHKDKALPRPTTFVMNMMLGDIVEAVFKGLLKEAGVKYEEPKTVSLQLDDATIDGTYDIVIDDAAGASRKLIDVLELLMKHFEKVKRIQNCLGSSRNKKNDKWESAIRNKNPQTIKSKMQKWESALRNKTSR